MGQTVLRQVVNCEPGVRLEHQVKVRVCDAFVMEDDETRRGHGLRYAP